MFWCGHINYGPLAQLVSLRRKKVAGGEAFNERCSAVRLQASESEARQALQANDRSAVDEASAEFYEATQASLNYCKLYQNECLVRAYKLRALSSVG